MADKKVVVEMSVDEFLKLRLTVGSIISMLREYDDILQEMAKKPKLRSSLRDAVYDCRQSIDEINETRLSVAKLSGIFSYSSKDK